MEEKFNAGHHKAHKLYSVYETDSTEHWTDGCKNQISKKTKTKTFESFNGWSTLWIFELQS